MVRCELRWSRGIGGQDGAYHDELAGQVLDGELRRCSHCDRVNDVRGVG